MSLIQVKRVSGAMLAAAAACAGSLLLSPLDSTEANGRNASCLGKPATVLGTDRSETIQGTDDDDVILARRGNDTIYSRTGDDLICGAAGDDLLCGGVKPSSSGGSGPPERCRRFFVDSAGRKQISGGSGEDKLFIRRGTMRGGRDDDKLDGGKPGTRHYGGPGADVLYDFERDPGRMYGFGGAGPDEILFSHTNDLLRGGGGSDRIHGGGGSDRIRGGAGDDRLTGNINDDRLYGDDGDDDLDGGDGRDSCLGGQGADRQKDCE